METEFSIQQVAQLTGLSIDTSRYNAITQPAHADANEILMRLAEQER